MDRVRLGRVLGRGARMAARTVYDAVDAATTPTPRAPTPAANSAPQRQGSPLVPAREVRAGASRPAESDRPATGANAPLRQAVRGAAQVHGAAQGARRGVLAPVKRASRSLALELTGSFFALFALSFTVAVWRTRDHLHDAAYRGRLTVYALLAVVFVYFAASSFVRASRVQRG